MVNLRLTLDQSIALLDTKKAQIVEKKHQLERQKVELHREKEKSGRLERQVEHSDEIIAAREGQIEKMKGKLELNFR